MELPTEEGRTSTKREMPGQCQRRGPAIILKSVAACTLLVCNGRARPDRRLGWKLRKSLLIFPSLCSCSPSTPERFLSC
ncbi:hypothetical protein DAI22_03g005850 [Oryza sativa Japonica Group]|nr:hypothetical protein DAI22_03g005850 [Oryza sativa Japonica Group]